MPAEKPDDLQGLVEEGRRRLDAFRAARTAHETAEAAGNLAGLLVDDVGAIATLIEAAEETITLRAEVERLRAALANGCGPDAPTECPAGHHEQCCGHHDACRAALGKGGVKP